MQILPERIRPLEISQLRLASWLFGCLFCFVSSTPRTYARKTSWFNTEKNSKPRKLHWVHERMSATEQCGVSSGRNARRLQWNSFKEDHHAENNCAGS
jgi:hypothetical protein